MTALAQQAWMRLYGIHPVLEALRAGRVISLAVADRERPRLRAILRLAAEQGVPVRSLSANALARAAQGGAHQGVLAEVAPRRAYTVQDLVRAAASVPLLVVLDGVEDPHNVGAILRTADAAGADGIIHQTRRAARLGGGAARSSAGALAHARVAAVVNVARALDELKRAGVWTVGLSGEAVRRYDAVDFTLPTAVVVGAEGKGLRRIVRARCDWLVSIPMAGHVASLNVSVAAAVALFEAVRQRAHAGQGDAAGGKGAWR